MSTITREWLQQAINDYESVRDEIPFGLDDYQGNILAALRIALASLEAESVGFRSKLQPPSAIGSEHWDYTDHRQPDAFELKNCVIERLFTAPPAPVSVPILSEDTITQLGWDLVRLGMDEETKNDKDLTYKLVDRGIEKIRAAMLQGADGNSPVIPDWQAKAEKMSELHGSSFVVFRSGESPQCADPSKVVISFTDEGLDHGSEAPQQEVKP